jgi:ubiquinone/menaquinone biosynthesis C-methylase UbiE
LKTFFVSPIDHSTLTFDERESVFRSKNGDVFPVKDGVPDFTYPRNLNEGDGWSKTWYDKNADVYDKYLHLTFDTFGVNETTTRLAMIEKLKLSPGMKVLETGAGTGRDSLLISEQIGSDGEIHLQDISAEVLFKAEEKLRNTKCKKQFWVGNAQYLPYPDAYFDAYYHFGGLNTFNDKKRAFKEISRVVKPGGRVVVGDESMPPFYRDTEFGKVLMNSNPHYNYDLPLSDMDHTTRDLSIHYVVGGVFYYMEYTVGSGEPVANLDFEIPGERGGTHRTRFYGKLEGVSVEAMKMAHEARSRSGKSMHQWLSDVVLKAANDQLKL